MSARANKTDYSALAGVAKKDGKKGKGKNAVPTLSEDPIPSNDKLDCSSCKILADLVRTLLKKQSDLEKEVADLKSDKPATDLLKQDVEDLKDRLPGAADDDTDQDLQVRVKALAKQMEDRTNRQLRQTMVLRNLKEDADEKTWDDTRDLVANKITELIGVEFEEAKRLINRCHRGGDPKYYKAEKRIRPIYIAFMRWDTCEKLLHEARKQNVFSLDYKYAPRTTVRRNNALKLRRELKTNGDIVSGYVKFPAVLMGKKSVDAKYDVIRDFSDDEVVFEKKKK